MRKVFELIRLFWIEIVMVILILFTIIGTIVIA